jgi:TrwC relaxase
VAVVATLSKGYDLDYIWKQVDRGPAKDAADYYIQASETGGEPPGRWWGPGALALGLKPGQTVERQPYDLLFGQRKAPDGTPLGRPPDGGRKLAGIYARLLSAEPHATAGRRRELRIEAARQTRQSPLFFDLTLSCPRASPSSTPPWARTPAWPARPATTTATSTGLPWSKKSTR